MLKEIRAYRFDPEKHWICLDGAISFRPAYVTYDESGSICINLQAPRPNGKDYFYLSWDSLVNVLSAESEA